MFEEIAKEMQLITKTCVTGTHCENKWKVLERSYKKFIDNSKLTGRERKVFEYADIMHSILEKKKNIHPVLLLSSDTINALPESSKENGNIIEMSTEENTEPEMTEREIDSITTVKKRKAWNNPIPNTNKRTKFNILREIRHDRKEYYAKRLEIEEMKLLEQKKRNDLLEKYLEKNMYLPRMDLLE